MSSESLPPDTIKPLDPRVWKVAGVVILGPFMTSLDSTVVNVALSKLATDLQASIATTQWVISGYLLALALMLPLNGWLVDRIGAKKVYLACFSLFTVASLLCGAAQTMNQLILFRVFQGMAGGLLAPMAQMMLARIAGKQIARVMGYTIVPIFIAPILGSVVAGLILKYSTWRWLFYLNLPIGILAIVLAMILLPNDETSSTRRRFDLLGFLLLSPGLAALLYGFEYWKTDAGKCSLALALPLLGFFFLHAKKLGQNALVDLGMFRNRIFSVGATLQFISNGFLFAGQMLVPLYLLSGCGLTSTQVGLLMAPAGIGTMISYPMMGYFTDRFGFRKVAVTGAWIAFFGTLPFLWMVETKLSIELLCTALVVRGLGIGAIAIPTMAASYSSVPRERLAIATTAINIVQRLGGPIATTMVAIIMESANPVLADHTPATFFGAFIFLLVIQLFGVGAAYFLPERVNAANVEPDSSFQAVEALND